MKLYSIQRLVSDGTLQTFSVSIQYFSKSHITVYVADAEANGVNSPYTWAWDGDRIRMSAVIPAGTEVMVRRRTPYDVAMHIYSQGAAFTNTSMDQNFLQMLFINQENIEGLTATDFYSDLDLHNYRLKNVGTAIANGDAVSFGQYRADAMGAYQHRLVADQARTEALASKNAAATSAVQAETSASTSTDAATQALASKNAAANSAAESSTASAVAVAASNNATAKATHVDNVAATVDAKIAVLSSAPSENSL